MNSLLFLMLGAGALMLSTFCSSTKLQKALQRHSQKIGVLPQAISLLAITVQIHELVKVLEHVSLVHVAASLFLLAIVLATKSGTEGGLH